MQINSNNLVFDVKNDSTQTTTLFNADNNRILSIKLNEDKQIIDSLSTKLITEKYSIIGSNYNKNTNILYCKDEKSGDLFAISFDFLNKKTTHINIPLNIEKDNNIYNFSQNDKFYMLYTIKGTNNLKINSIDFKGNITSHIIDISNFKLLNYYNNPTTLYKSIGSFYGTFAIKNFTVIDSKSNISLIEASSKTKLYIKENQLIFTFDISKSVTQILNVNLKDFTANVNHIATPLIGASLESITEMESNSFLIDDKLFQFKITSELEIITIKTLDGQLIKTYILKPEKETTENSNSYYIISPTEKETEVLKNSKDFLERSSKIGYGSGIYCTKINDTYQINFGAVSDLQHSSAITMLPVFGVIGALTMLVSEKTSSKNISIYKKRYAVFASLNIDNQLQTFSNQKSDFKVSEIEEYISKTKKISNFTISKFGEKQILGFYDENTKMYNFTEFEN
ncbi:MAG: hypothetical protein PHC28_06580 [Flavobacterium sp.]|uniref:hypothetical protein n=1 Tax=Flavobacterium sp. TaxID=239 RepID=UPI00263904C7|nr:hypothetical protein [Flavobacterium sp.]MDD5150136.1 hypothetical protein [Flavobacterium sp.]